MDKALMLNGWLVRNNLLVSIIGWACFAVICANYAGFIKLPTLVAVPLWAGLIANFLRWGIWEGLLKPHVERAIIERAKDGGVHARGGLPPSADS